MEPLWRHMAIEWETIFQWLLSFSALILVWLILRLRQKRIIASLSNIDDYSGEARDPEQLMRLDDEAMTELSQLLDDENVNWEN
ncbi:MAG TPA: hypothetical protein QF508_04010 [Candidatus Thalassarchaeaceae archaeon]|nr:hypothetical protein [Candidatus Thalassarchaeaceae archaeon]|tara:strand:+ start:1284 stop:1535 length:252 start_codon:yes stop_codon:yes gene_type:complete